MTSYRLMDGIAGRPGVGSSGTRPPVNSTTSLTGPYVVGTCFKVTSPCWLEGYWWYVCASGGQLTAPQKFCLWSANRDGSHGGRGSVVPAGTVTSGTFTTGQFNYVPLATPVPLTIGWTYIASTGWNVTSGGIPFTASGFGSGAAYSAGITNGPLTGFSDLDGSNPDPFACPQTGDNRAGSDPAVNFPNNDASGFMGWIDLQVTDTPPANPTYRLFPSIEGWQLGTAPDFNSNSTDTNGYVVGNTFSLSQPCNLLKLWFLSESGAAILPSRCGIWDVGTQTVVSGTDNPSPAWLNESGSAASAGGGWAYCDYSGAGIVLPSGRNMITAVYSGGGQVWRAWSIPFWGTGGISPLVAINIGANGLNYGVISAPSTAGGVPLQGGFWGPGAGWGFPSNWNNPENDWIDVEVSPAPQPPPPQFVYQMRQFR